MAILIEEGTTNLLSSYGSFETDSNADGLADGWYVNVSGGDSGRVYNNRLVPALYHGQYAQRIEIVSTTNSNTTNLGCSNISISPNTTYTLSAYVKTNVPNKVRLLLEWYDASGAWIGGTESNHVTVTNQVVRISVTATSPSNAAKVTAYVRGINSSGEWFEVDAVQLEAKPYATSFIDGTRAAETLTIPTAGVLNPQEGTIEFWWNPLSKNPQTYPSLISTGNWTAPITQDWLSINWGSGWNNANTVTFSLYNKDGTSNFNFTITLNPQPYTWYYVAAKWSFITRIAKLIIYKPDGTNVAYQATVVGNPPTFEGWDKFYILQTWNNGSSRANSLIDDLRISNRARTDTEIAQAYASGQPLQKDDSTTYLLPFNGSIYPVEQVWVPLGTFWSLDWDSPDDVLEATVTARDRLELLRKGTYQSSQVQTNVSLYTLAQQVLQDAGLDSTEYNIDTALQSIIVPYAWFNSTTHREALRTIAEAALAVVYADRDGILQIKSFNSFSNDTLAITDDDYFLPLRNPSQQSQVSNKIIVNTNPLTPQATQEVYRSNSTISVPANGSTTITAFYNQTPVINATASIDGSPSGVSIASVTYYGWGATVKIQNTNSTSASVTLVINGQPLTVQNKEQYIAQDDTSITENGELQYEYPDNPLIQTLSQAQQIATTLLASVKDARRDIQMDWRGNPALLLGDKVTVKGNNYYVIRQEITWQGYLEANLTGRRVE